MFFMESIKQSGIFWQICTLCYLRCYNLLPGLLERATNLLVQFNKREPFTYENAAVGLRTLLGGMILKIVVADNLAKYVNAVYNNVSDYVGWPLLFTNLPFLLFKFFVILRVRRYMAISIARIMGINLMENFG